MEIYVVNANFETVAFKSEEGLREYFFEDFDHDYDGFDFESWLEDNYSVLTILQMDEEEREEVYHEYDEYCFEEWKDENVEVVELND